MMNQAFPSKKINDLLSVAWNNERSLVYRKHMEKNGFVSLPEVTSYEEFKKIPTTSREMLNEYPHPSERLFVPENEIDLLGFTSGTSGKKPLFFWRFVGGDFQYETFFKLYKNAGVVRGLLFRSISSGVFFSSCARKHGIQTINGDSRNIKKSLTLIATANIDMLHLPPTLGIILGKELHDIGLEKQIKLVCLYGEYCSEETYTLLQKLYPCAHFVFEFGITEAGCFMFLHSSHSCNYPNKVFHIDPNLVLVEEIEGEMLITTLPLPHAMPLIRYKTGDAIRLLDNTCSCKSPFFRLELLGRIESDRIRIAGGGITVEELDKVMSPFLLYIDPRYQLEVGERIVDKKRIGTLVLSVSLRNDVRISSEGVATLIARALNKDFRLTQTLRLGNAIEAGLIDPISIQFKEVPMVGNKHKKLLQNFS